MTRYHTGRRRVPGTPGAGHGDRRRLARQPGLGLNTSAPRLELAADLPGAAGGQSRLPAHRFGQRYSPPAPFPPVPQHHQGRCRQPEPQLKRDPFPSAAEIPVQNGRRRYRQDLASPPPWTKVISPISSSARATSAEDGRRGEQGTVTRFSRRTAGRRSWRPVRADGRMRRGLLKKPERRGRGRQGPPERWLAPGDIRELYQRRIGLLVRRGDPRHLLIREDLAREDIQVLDVQLEPMGEFQGSPGASRQGRRIDLDPPGFLSRATSHATAIPIGATSTATPAPAHGRQAWVSTGLCPQTAMTETTAMLQDVTAGWSAPASLEAMPLSQS
ncbi:MAG: hypothetical protein WB608_19825 [Terracidiphilus sp.]